MVGNIGFSKISLNAIYESITNINATTYILYTKYIYAAIYINNFKWDTIIHSDPMMYCKFKFSLKISFFDIISYQY